MADQLITGTTLIEDKRTDYGKIWSVSGKAFSAENPDVHDMDFYGDTSMCNTDGAGISVQCNVTLPQGSDITSCKVYGNTATELWYFWRAPLSTGVGEQIASAFINTADATPTDEKTKIDNDTYCYWIFTEALDANDKIYGAKIKYD